MGILQWNATNALKLLQEIIATSGANAQQILNNTELYNKIKQIYPGMEQRTALALYQLKHRQTQSGSYSSVGVSVQNNLAISYIYDYITLGYNTYKITNVSALCYFCDIKNQCGSTTVDRIAKKAIQLAGGDPKFTLP